LSQFVWPGSVSVAPAFPRTYTQDTYSFSDIVSFPKGAHALKIGGSLARLEENFDFAGLGSAVQLLSWPDFLLRLDALHNDTGMYSNVFASRDAFDLLNRELTGWESALFVQHSYRIRPSLTLNLGLRYKRLGQFGDELGRNSSFDVSKAIAHSPPSGSLDGYIAASNFPGDLPPGVLRAKNTFGTYGEGQDTIAPRIGFAWQVLPRTSQLALRGGYGIYYYRPTGQTSAQSILGAPFSVSRVSTGLANAVATFEASFVQPFPTPSFPEFEPYSITTKSTVNALAPRFCPAMVHQFWLNTPVEVKQTWLLEIGYVGARGTHLQRLRSLNQALDASPDNPINGVTSNTVAYIGSRVPIPGILSDSLREIESEGNSRYNGLEASLTKRLGHGLQFLASYTFSKTLDTDGANINGTAAGNSLTLGDQNSPTQRWGRASFDRTHRFVLNETWSLPSPSGRLKRAILGGWDFAAVVTIQSGSALTLSATNANNVFGISTDRAQLSRTCSKHQLVKGGSVKSKLGGYFNTACFASPSIIGADGIGTTFGNSATGLVDGPGQAKLNLAFSKTVVLRWPVDRSNLEFRAEFFNALNHTSLRIPTQVSHRQPSASSVARL